jgi:hypothetical protein
MPLKTGSLGRVSSTDKSRVSFSKCTVPYLREFGHNFLEIRIDKAKLKLSWFLFWMNSNSPQAITNKHTQFTVGCK